MTAGARAMLRRLCRDDRGIAAVEFAILAPVLLVLIMGLMDIAYNAYAQAALEGAMQKAGRDSGIEAANTSTIDENLKAKVRVVIPNATFLITRKSYSSFGTAAPERFDDANNNGQYDSGECFYDVNGNRVWDRDPGITGQGGASDVTLYTVTVSYNRLFPLAKLLGWPQTQTTTATTLLKNQPYQTQAVPTVTKICS
ncbi:MULTISPECIES: TadE/TadG family type IV pilus assembly protein [unclassified Sphingomonas]|jgi:Flp pilus assembly protein TadG|nr:MULTISPECIES: TadE/TadG family type IV pilus assembly protein [unclassified Sphingomonas]